AEGVGGRGGGDRGAGDRGAPRAAVGLQHVAVEPERPLAERGEVGDRAQRTSDQALDLDRAPLLAPRARLALRPLAGRGGKERVLGGHPAPPPAGGPARPAPVRGRPTQPAGPSPGEERPPVPRLEGGGGGA